MKRADQALYRSKSQGGLDYCFYASGEPMPRIIAGERPLHLA